MQEEWGRTEPVVESKARRAFVNGRLKLEDPPAEYRKIFLKLPLNHDVIKETEEDNYGGGMSGSSELK